MSLLARAFGFCVLGLAFVALTLTAEGAMYRGYETPSYAVERMEGAIEVRRYAPTLVAEVQVRGSRREAIGTGFRVLADYIFGGNDGGQKVAMTTPVTQMATDADASVWTVRFMMPAEVDLTGPPAPDNDAIRFVRTEVERQIALRFTGRWQETRLHDQENELRAWAARNGYVTVGPPIYAFYDGPFTVPWSRRNEVAFVIE